MERAKELHAEGSSLYSAADYNSAFEKFTQALKIVTAEGGEDAHLIRAALLLNIAQSHIHAYDVDADPGHLRAAKSIYARFVDEAGRGAGYSEADVEEAQRQIEDLDERLDALEPDESPPPEPGEGPKAGLSGPAEADIVRTRSLGIGLAVGGAVLTLGGVGLIIYGTTFRNFAIESIRQEAKDPTLQPEDFDAEQNVHFDKQLSNGRAWMIGGGVGTAIGIAGIAVGAWQISKAGKMRRESRASAFVTPLVTRDLAGLSLHGRF